MLWRQIPTYRESYKMQRIIRKKDYEMLLKQFLIYRENYKMQKKDYNMVWRQILIYRENYTTLKGEMIIDETIIFNFQYKLQKRLK